MSITPSFSAHRSTGVAPLGVIFDASATTSTATTRPFHECLYYWDYGDWHVGSDTWAPSGGSKNCDYGPIGAHLYAYAGTYTVTLTVRDTDGTQASTSSTISVTNPDTIFSGASTICFSASGDFTGAPAGATQITTSSWSNITSYVAAGRRLLLHRGEAWSASTTCTIANAGPGQIGAYGTGDDPIVTGSGTVPLFTLSNPAGVLADWRISDLTLDGVGHDTIEAAGSVTNLTIDGSTLLRGGVIISPDIVDYYRSSGYPSAPAHSGLVIYDTSITGLTGYGGFIACRKAAYVGCVFEQTTGGESHCLRLPCFERSVIAHTRFGPQPQSLRQHLKLHNAMWAGWEYSLGAASAWYHVASEYWVIHDCEFRGAGSANAWMCEVGLQDNLLDERTSNGIIESNWITIGDSCGTVFGGFSSSTTYRNNCLSLTGGISPIAFHISNWPSGSGVAAPNPDLVWVYGNSIYSANTSGTVTLVDLTHQSGGLGEATNVAVFNNVIASPTTRRTIYDTCTGLTSGTNTSSATDPGWTTYPPTTAMGFGLTSGSTLRDTGTVVPVLSDYQHLLRTPATADVGAHEYGASAIAPSASPVQRVRGIRRA